MVGISIHAPQWGATGSSTVPSLPSSKFQSTHPSGVRRACWHQPRRKPYYFNPRTPVGCDSLNGDIKVNHGLFQSTHPSGVRRYHRHAVRRVRQISIHAPQWGATPSRWFLRMFHVFQSTHPSGVRQQSGYVVDKLFGFQSTHPSGVRPPPTRAPSSPYNFNPRTPVGCDGHPCPRRRHPDMISIHAPQWGANRFLRT